MTTTTQRLTLQDCLKLPDIEESPAWEFVDGYVSQKPMPTAHHSILQKRLTAAIDQVDSPYEAFPELRCTLSNHSVVPDIPVIHRNRVPSENIPIPGAPERIIEILSPEQSTTKSIANIQACLEEGTQLGWLFDSTERVIMVLLPDRSLALLSNGDCLPVLQDLPLVLTVDQVFAWLQPSSK